jgi:hypothetical protein
MPLQIQNQANVQGKENSKPKEQHLASSAQVPGDSLDGDEGDELGDALLHGLLGVLGDLPVGWDGLLHDAADVGDGQEPVLLPDTATTAPRTPALVAPTATPGTSRPVRHPVVLHDYHPTETLDPSARSAPNSSPFRRLEQRGLKAEGGVPYLGAGARDVEGGGEVARARGGR